MKTPPPRPNSRIVGDAHGIVHILARRSPPPPGRTSPRRRPACRDAHRSAPSAGRSARPVRHLAAAQQPRAFGDALRHLLVQLVAQIARAPSGRRRWSRPADRRLGLGHLRTSCCSKRSCSCLDDDEALGGDAALPGIDQPRLRAGCRGEFEIGVDEHEIGVAAAQLQHASSSAPRRLWRRHRGRPACCRSASPRAHAGVRSTSPTILLPIIRVRNRFCGKPASTKQRSRCASAQPGTFEACFSTPALPAISAGAAKRNTCQNGKFHGMTASTTPSGRKATKLLRGLVVDHLVGEKALGMFGVVVAAGRTFLRLRRCRRGWACPFPAPSAGRTRAPARAKVPRLCACAPARLAKPVFRHSRKAACAASMAALTCGPVISS